MAFQSKTEFSKGQSGPASDDNVVSFDKAKKSSNDKGKTADGAKGKRKAQPSVEDRWVSWALRKKLFVLGRQAQGEDPDVTLYSWVDDALGARWQRQVDKVVRGEICSWLSVTAPSYVGSSKVGSCLQVMRDILIAQKRTLGKCEEDADVVPLRNAYLLIDKSGKHKGRIRAVKPNPKYGQTYTIQADIDWSRVEDDDVYVPEEPKEGGYWHRYLSSTFTDTGVYNLAQEAYSMALLSTCYEKAVWMYGGGENGKSCMLHILRSLSPNATAAISITRLSRNEFGNNQLIGKRIAVCSEMPKILTAEVQEILKGLVSHDPTQAEFKGKDAFTFIPETTFFFATNHHPIMPDHEHGWWRKVVTIPFLHRVKKEEKILGLDRLITDNPAEMIQVIDWMLIGAARLTARGRFLADDEMPEPVRDIAKAQRLVSDPVAAWIFEHEPKVDDCLWTNKQAIYDHFRDYTQDQGRKVIAQNSFWLRVGEHFRDESLDTQGQQLSVPEGGRPRHVQLLVPDVAPTKKIHRLTPEQIAMARKNPPEVVHGSDLPDTLPEFQ